MMNTKNQREYRLQRKIFNLAQALNYWTSRACLYALIAICEAIFIIGLLIALNTGGIQ